MNVAPFLFKTWNLVSDPTTNDIVSWSPDGVTFIVHRPDACEREILPNVFKHSNFASFVRQLNNYGFRKCHTDRYEFGVPGFQRGKPELLKSLRRHDSQRGVKKAAVAAAWAAAAAEAGHGVGAAGGGGGGAGHEGGRSAARARFLAGLHDAAPGDADDGADELMHGAGGGDDADADDADAGAHHRRRGGAPAAAAASAEGDVAALRRDGRVLALELKCLRESHRALRADVTALRGEVSALRASQQGMEARMKDYMREIIVSAAAPAPGGAGAALARGAAAARAARDDEKTAAAGAHGNDHDCSDGTDPEAAAAGAMVPHRKRRHGPWASEPDAEGVEHGTAAQ